MVRQRKARSILVIHVLSQIPMTLNTQLPVKPRRMLYITTKYDLVPK